MSKVKNPQQKKRLSLDRDRRHTFYENKKASRKNIPKAQQRRRMAGRRGVSQILNPLKGHVDEDVAVQAELDAKIKIFKTRIRGFRKIKDKPLREMVAEKLKRRST